MQPDPTWGWTRTSPCPPWGWVWTPPCPTRVWASTRPTQLEVGMDACSSHLSMGVDTSKPNLYWPFSLQSSLQCQMHPSEKTTSSHTCYPCNFLCQGLSCYYTAPIHSALCLCKQKQGHCARMHLCPAPRWAWFAPTSKVGRGKSAPNLTLGLDASTPSSKVVRLQPGAWGLLVATLDMPLSNSAVHSKNIHRAATVQFTVKVLTVHNSPRYSETMIPFSYS